MSLLSIAQAVAKNTGIEVPDTVQGDGPDAVKLRQFINETGDELARRVDWSSLRKTATLAGTGFNAPYNLPDDYSRLISGLAVRVNGSAVRGGLTADEWNALDPVEGTPRYFQTIANQIALYPYPPEGMAVTLTYQGTNWVRPDKREMVADADETFLPERLLEMGAVWRSKRHIGADYGDYLAEFEAAITDLAGFDDRVRIP